MISKVLLLGAVAALAMAVIFSSPAAAVAGAVLGVFSFAAKGIDL